MFIISHRGNLTGPDPEHENHPDYICKAIKDGFNVEIDLRYINGKWFLGHDGPQYEIELNFLTKNSHRLFIHAKNIEVLYELSLVDQKIKYKYSAKSEFKRLHYFFHDEDDCALTSRGILWTFTGKQLTKRSIAVMPERIAEWDNIANCYAICTDYCYKYKDLYVK